MKKIFIVLVLLLGASLFSHAFAATSIPVYAHPIILPGNVVTPVAEGAPQNSVPSVSPASCMQRPACLDAHPPCMIAEPASGWCKTTPTSFPTPMHCGGFIKNAPVCPTGYTCKLGRIPDTGGFCVPDTTPTPVISHTVPVPTTAGMHTSPVASFMSGIFGFFKNLFHF